MILDALLKDWPDVHTAWAVAYVLYRSELDKAIQEANQPVVYSFTYTPPQGMPSARAQLVLQDDTQPIPVVYAAPPGRRPV